MLRRALAPAGCRSCTSAGVPCITRHPCSAIRKRMPLPASSSSSSRFRSASASPSPAACRRCPDSSPASCGGLVVPWISRSPLSVTGPAAGLTSIVLAEVAHLGGIPPFLTAVVLAGVLQVDAGRAAARAVQRAGAFGGDQGHAGGHRHHDHLEAAARGLRRHRRALRTFPGSCTWAPLAIAAAVAGAALRLEVHADGAQIKLISPALVAVVVASALAEFLRGSGLGAESGTVRRGAARRPRRLWPRRCRGPTSSAIVDPTCGSPAATIAVVASIETLLSLQAVDRLDPLKRHSPPDRELLAQGTANAVSGLLGGLPVTAVIVRSGANVAAGARERLSALVHGALLLLAVLFAGALLNRIPLACLAAVLIQVGLNLCKPALFSHAGEAGHHPAAAVRHHHHRGAGARPAEGRDRRHRHGHRLRALRELETGGGGRTGRGRPLADALPPRRHVRLEARASCRRSRTSTTASRW